jgi:Transglutaminase-like superfamily/Domain of Unknown Function with PDB structure (DUF3857)
MMNLKQWILATAMGCIACVSKAQSFQEIQARYPNEPAVFLNYKTELRLFLQNDTPAAERKQVNDLMILSENNAGLFSRSAVYHSGFNQLTSMEAYTLVPGSKKKIPIGQTKTQNSTSRSVFYDDVQETSFDYPALTQGAIAHIEYTQLLKEAHLISPFSYGAGIPGLNVSFTAIVPDNMEIRYIIKNDPKGLLKLTTEKKRGNTYYNWSMQHVKNEDGYGDAPDDRYYQPHVIVHITKYTNSAGQQTFIQSVDDLYRWNASFTKTLNQTEDPTLRAITDSLVKPLQTPLQKAEAIYKWVQNHIRYVAFENGLEGFRPRQAAEVCSKRYGDCKDMSSIITQMLRMAGIEAYYTWIGTRDIPYTYTDVPLPIVDNHMIAVARIDNRWYFIDGTSPSSSIYLPPSSIQHKQALVGISDTKYEILTVPVADPVISSVEDSTFIHFTADGIAGKEKVLYKGYYAEDVHNALLYRDEKRLKEYVKTRMGKASNKFMLGEYKVTKHEAPSLEARIVADFEVPGYGKKVGNEYYINLNLEKLFENQLIDTAKRKVPRQFEYQGQITSHHILDIPAGYEVSYHPKDFEVETTFYKLKVQYKKQTNRIIATQQLTTKILMLEPTQFAEWNAQMPRIQAHYKEQIVLEKQ